jgi:hypothetical protein
MDERRVGIYDVRVVRSDDANGLISWLNESSFRFTKDDAAAFDSYVSKGWCFVVAVINPAAEHKAGEVAAEGLAAPLILRFKHPNPVYPLALTGTGGFDTEVLIYLASDHKMSADGRMTLRFAGAMNDSSLRTLFALVVDPEDFFLGSDDMEYPYLCKFKDTLTPAQMREDLVFRRAGDDKPFRERMVDW